MKALSGLKICRHTFKNRIIHKDYIGLEPALGAQSRHHMHIFVCVSTATSNQPITLEPQTIHVELFITLFTYNIIASKILVKFTQSRANTNTKIS